MPLPTQGNNSRGTEEAGTGRREPSTASRKVWKDEEAGWDFRDRGRAQETTGGWPGENEWQRFC